MHATLEKLEQLFDRLYPINRQRPRERAPALGRYEGDVYFSGGAYYFSTLGAAEFCFLAAAAHAPRQRRAHAVGRARRRVSRNRSRLHAGERRSFRAVRSTHRRANVREASRVELCRFHLVRDGAPSGALAMTRSARHEQRGGPRRSRASGRRPSGPHDLPRDLRVAGGPAGHRAASTVLVVAILVTSYGQVILNDWNQPFYDAITRRDLNEFLYQLGVYFVIVACLLVLDVSQRWLTETIKFRLREGLTRDLLKLWMAPRRAFWLATSGGQMGVNPDQRMSEDAQKLCDISADLSIGLFRVERAARELRGRALDDFRRLHVPRRRRRLRRAGFHAVGRDLLCRRGLAALAISWAEA